MSHFVHMHGSTLECLQKQPLLVYNRIEFLSLAIDCSQTSHMSMVSQWCCFVTFQVHPLAIPFFLTVYLNSVWSSHVWCCSLSIV